MLGRDRVGRPALPDSLRRARVSVAATFAIHGFISGSWATRIPAIKDDLALGEGELGIALTGLAAGLFLGTRLTGRPVGRAGTRLPIRTVLPLQCVSLIGPALATDLVTLTLAFAFVGLWSGFLDVVMNLNAVVVERDYRRPIMSGLHGMWSGGLLAGSSVGATAAALRVGVPLHFGAVALTLAVAALVLTRGLLATAVEAPRGPGGRRPRNAVRIGAVLLLGAIAFSSFAAEGSAADWSAVYVHETVGTGQGVAGLAFAAFSLGMIASRFAADAVSARFGPVFAVRTGGLVAAGGLTLALAVPSQASAIVGFLLFGVGLAPIVPITFSAAGADGRDSAGLSWVVTIAYVGAVTGPAVIGFAADAVSLRAALTFPVLLALAAAALASAVASAPGGRR